MCFVIYCFIISITDLITAVGDCGHRALTPLENWIIGDMAQMPGQRRCDAIDRHRKTPAQCKRAAGEIETKIKMYTRWKSWPMFPSYLFSRETEFSTFKNLLSID